MNSLDQQYYNLLKDVHEKGSWSSNRTGIKSKALPNGTITHDMSEGYPLLTIKRVPFKSMAVELEGFIKGVSSKKWYQERKCTIWNEWCNPQKVPYGTDEETQRKMLEEDDLGIIYGNNWRDFHCPNAVYVSGYNAYGQQREGYVRSRGVDQLKNIIQTLKNKPNDRRMLCLSWNPLALEHAALPACHVLWNINVIGDKLHLTWYQRSVDFCLGSPYNIASYGLLLHLLSKVSGIEMGTLTGFFTNVHYYENQIEGVEEILSRNPDRTLPTIDIPEFETILDWEARDTKIRNYNPLPTIKMPVAV